MAVAKKGKTQAEYLKEAQPESKPRAGLPLAKDPPLVDSHPALCKKLELSETSKHNESHRKKLAERESIDVAGAGVHEAPGLTSEAHCQLGRQSAAWQETLSVDVDVKLFLSFISINF